MHLVLETPSGGQLWLGGVRASGSAELMLQNGVSAVLSAASRPVPVRDARIESLGTFDGTGVIGGAALYLKLVKAFGRVLELLAAGHKVLICCRNGRAQEQHDHVALPCVGHRRVSGCGGGLPAHAPQHRRAGQAPPQRGLDTPIDFAKKMESDLRSRSAAEVPQRLVLNRVLSPNDFRLHALTFGFVQPSWLEDSAVLLAPRAAAPKRRPRTGSSPASAPCLISKHQAFRR